MREEAESLRQERDNLQQQVDQLAAQVQLFQQASAQPEVLEAIRDRVLANLNLGKQAPQYKAIAKALEQFIREVRIETPTAKITSKKAPILD